MILKNQHQKGIMLKLRSYQNDAIEAINKTFKNEFRQYVEMPTGSGKTITFLSYARKHHKNILIIVPSQQLLHQVVESALLLYEPWEISRKGAGYNEECAFLHVCIINSIRGDYLDYLAKEKHDLIIIDEAHHSQSPSYQRLIKNKLNFHLEKSMRFLGVTATPDRADGKLLDEILYKCSFKLNVKDLIKQKHLSDIEGYSVKTKIDLSEIDDRNGDFSLFQLYNKLCIESRNNMIVDLCCNDMKNRKTLIFCINIKHSKEINSLLQKKGIASAHIDGTKKNNSRESILDSFRKDEISVLTNCQLLTEGFDEPSIDGIILARPTRSIALFNQMIGRGLRNFPGKKNCKIIDVVDNHKSLAGFNNIICDVKYPGIQKFNSIEEIQKHISNEMFKISEFSLERSNLLFTNYLSEINPTQSMYEYLEDNNILHYSPTFDEANFLIWMNELKKEYVNGYN